MIVTLHPFSVSTTTSWVGTTGANPTEESVESLFRRFFPDAIPLIPDLTQSFLANPTGVLGTVRSAPWHHRDRVMLLGDAAHAIVPFFGQGMNSGFEDCTVLAQLLDENAAVTGDPELLDQRVDARP